MSEHVTDPEALEFANTVLAGSIGIVEKMGVRFVELGRGFVAAEVPLEGNLNHIAMMYAGVLFTVAEVLGGGIAMGSFDLTRFYPTVKDLQIRFRRPATSTIRATAALPEEDLVRIAAEAAQTGRSEWLLDAELTDASGEVVARTHGVYQLRSHGS